MTISRRRAVLAVVIAVAAACARGADEARVQADLQERLNKEVKAGLFEVVGVRREGSAPMPAGDSGAERVVVYYNATLRLKSDYQFGGWDQLGGASLAFVLGATEKGVFGLAPNNKAGDVVRAYGSVIYERSGDAWLVKPTVPGAVAAAPIVEGTAPPSHSKQLIDKLAAMVDIPPPGVPAEQDEIIAQELEAASENIDRRFKRRAHTFTVATGPEDGEYTQFGSRLIDAVNEAAPDVKLRPRNSAGSVENAWLLTRNEADYAIVQGDVAAAAFTGKPPFDRGGPLGTLRAVGPLFPEPVHLIVLNDSPIRDVTALRKQRVAIGQPESGSRFDAIAVLAAYDLQLSDLHEAVDAPLTDALAKLRQKRVDAVFVTGAAPTRVLQQFAVSPGFRLISMDEDAINAVVQSRPGLARMTLPPNTYPRQQQPVATVAAMALLVTTVEAPEAEVQRVSDLVSTRLLPPPGGDDENGAVRAFESTLVAIPLHAGAARRAR